MKTISAAVLVLGSSGVANAYPSQPHASATRMMAESHRSLPTYYADGTGYDGHGSMTGGPVGGLPNRN